MSKNCAGFLSIATLVSVCGVLTAAPGEAFSQNYPARPVRLIVPFTPGGGTDLAARTLTPRLSEGLGQQVVVDNRPGAGGALGAELAAKAPPDGYTIWIGQTANLAIGPALRKQALYDPVRDFAPITMLQKSPSAIVVAAGSPIKSVNDLIAMAKKNPQGITYGSAGVGTAGHINGYLINVAAGIDMTHVPYKGSGLSMVDLMAGRVQVAITNTLTATPLVRSGKIKAIAVTSPQRTPAMPELPTVAESGLPNYELRSWYGLVAPNKTPPAIIQRMNQTIGSIMTLPDVRERLAADGAEATPAHSPEQFRAVIANEIKRWDAFLKRVPLKLD